MPPVLEFQHLRIPHVHSGKANLTGGSGESQQTKENKLRAQEHSDFILGKGRRLNEYWQRVREGRDPSAPELPREVPLLIQVDPKIDIDAVRTAFGFEIVAEYEDGYLVVAHDDLSFRSLEDKLSKLIGGQRGGGNAAKIYDLVDQEDQASKLARILSDELLAAWGGIDDTATYIVDVSVECQGTIEQPDVPARAERDTDETYARKLERHQQKLRETFLEWDELKLQRETDLERFVNGYEGTVEDIVDAINDGGAFSLADSFTARIRISGKGLRDLALNHAFIFEISTPETISGPISTTILGPEGAVTAEFQQPHPESPSVCVIDSGLQQAHPIINGAVNPAHSICMIPGMHGNVADEVTPNGHGTRVAGAVLFPQGIPRTGVHQHKCFVQNARVLDSNNRLPISIFPPKVIRDLVEKFNSEEFGVTKIYNHSISGNRPCPTKQMSAWASSIDLVSYHRDVLFIQSAGNIPETSTDPIQRGIREHLKNGDVYPEYLLKKSCRIANPAQSLSALTVGSVANPWTDGVRASFASAVASPSPFSRAGLGIWGDVKPEVVEFGGDLATDNGTPPTFTNPEEICPELIRAQNAPGPHFLRDEVGTSFSTPKVASIAVDIQKLFPGEAATLYKALIVQSARWPEWAFNDVRRQMRDKYIRYFGYGLPDASRALMNNEHRVTLHTSGEIRVKAGDVHVYNVPVPREITTQANNQRILVETTLCYLAEPRRTRRTHKRYLGVWVDWVTSRMNEPQNTFLGRVAKEFNKIRDNNPAIPWTLGMRENEGNIGETRRNLGTTQKDWAIVEAHQLPNSFCIAIRGHKGWSTDPEAYAKYSLVVSFESIDNDIEIYHPIRTEIDGLTVETAPLEV